MLRKLTIALLALGAATTATVVMAHGHDGHRFWDRKDANHDGFLDKTEAGQRLQQNFDTLDTNHDGKLSRDEVKAGWQAHTGDRKAERLAMIDTDKDGRVSWAEADAHAQSRAKARFDKADANHDGFLDTTEMAVGRHHRHHDMKDGR